MPCSVGACHDRRDVLLDRRRWRLLLGVAHAEAAAEVPDRERSEPAPAPAPRGETARARAAASRCARAAPRKRRPSTASTAAIAPGASAIEKPNFESAWPVEIFSWVSPRTSGVTRTSTGWAPRRQARPRRRAPPVAIDLVEVVDHDQPDPVAQRHPQLGLGLGVAVQHDPLGREARVSARCSSPPEATSHHSPSCGEQLSTAVQGKALEANTTWKSSWPASRPASQERAGAGAQVVLGDDVGRRPELARQLDRVAAADLEPPALVQAAAEGEDAATGLVSVAIAGGIIAARLQARPSRRSGRRRRPATRAAAPTASWHRPMHQHDALELRRRQPSRRPRCCGG